MSTSSPAPVPPRFQVSRMISSLWVPQAIYAAARLRLPDVLAAGPLTGEEVAEKAGTHPGAGIPGVVGSAKATATLMLEDML